jgi:hypothetical protein
MRTSTFVVGIVGLIVGAVIGAFVLTNFLPGAPPPKGPCPSSISTNANDHCIDVNVIMVGQQPQIQSIADERVKARGAIFWIIKTTGYTFPANGIDFVNIGSKPAQPSDPNEEFKNCKLMPGQEGKIFKCEDTYQHSNPVATYGYKITVENPPGTPAAHLDPFIVNG